MESQNTFVVSVEYFQSEYFPLKKLSSFKFISLNMITVCSRFSHSFKIMARHEPVAVQVLLLPNVQAVCYVRGGEDGDWFTCCVEGQEPKIDEVWTFAEDRTREVHPYARVQISDDFIRETFCNHFFNSREVQSS